MQVTASCCAHPRRFWGAAGWLRCSPAPSVKVHASVPALSTDVQGDGRGRGRGAGQRMPKNQHFTFRMPRKAIPSRSSAGRLSLRGEGAFWPGLAAQQSFSPGQELFFSWFSRGCPWSSLECGSSPARDSWTNAGLCSALPSHVQFFLRNLMLLRRLGGATRQPQASRAF